jgi:hypothetical protein
MHFISFIKWTQILIHLTGPLCKKTWHVTYTELNNTEKSEILCKAGNIVQSAKKLKKKKKKENYKKMKT